MLSKTKLCNTIWEEVGIKSAESLDIRACVWYVWQKAGVCYRIIMKTPLALIHIKYHMEICCYLYEGWIPKSQRFKKETSLGLLE